MSRPHQFSRRSDQTYHLGQRGWWPGSRQRKMGWLAFFCCSGLLLASVIVSALGGYAQQLPEFRKYPLPQSLATLKQTTHYAKALKTTPVGSLIWSEFPITIAIDLSNSTAPRAAAWQGAVDQAITEWQESLPLARTTDLKQANITIRRRSVPIRRDRQGKLQRIRLAETRFSFFVDGADRLRHRMTIDLSPNQADAALLMGARHELGHALGIWGHSDRPSDVMYFSQVAQLVGISERDRQTLKQVYQQPTRLGGKVIRSSQ